MASKTKINWTAYTVKGGKTKVNGTTYTIKKGITKISGTAKTIAFVVKAPPWTSGNINEIKIALDAYQAGKATDFSAWNIGDVRNFTLGSVTYQARLVHKFTNADFRTKRTDAQGDGSAAPNRYPYSIGTTDKLPAYAIMVTPQTGSSNWAPDGNHMRPNKYFESNLDNNINAQYNNLESGLKSILKQFQCYILNEGIPSGRTGYYQQLRYLAAPSCKEIGAYNNYGDENNYEITFDYFLYDSANRRKITGGASSWWTRSPSGGYDSGYVSWYRAYLVNGSDGSLNDQTYESYTNGTVWFGVI